MGKKILIVSQYFYPENFRINDIALTLKKRGHEVSVLTGLPNYPEGKIYQGYKDAYKQIEDYQGIKIDRLKISPRRNNKWSLIINYLSFMIKGWFWVRKHSTKYDLIFGFEVSPITQVLPAIWYGKKTDTQCVLYLQDIWPEALIMSGATKSKWVIRWVEKMVKYIYRHQASILVPSEAYIPWIKRLDESVEVSYWPQYAEAFYQPKTKSTLDIFKEDKFRIMFTGNIGTSQGLELLIELVDGIKHEISSDELECVLIGNGRAKKDLIDLVKSKDLNKYFRFMDAVEAKDIPDHLAHADLAYLSFKDNQLFNAVIPAKLQSYMACGVPVLGLVDGVSASIVKQAQGGIVISHQEENKKIRFIEAIQTSKEDLRDMGQNNINYAKNHFNKETLMNEFEKKYLSGESYV